MSSKNIIFDEYNSTTETLYFEVASESRPIRFDVWVDKQNHWICTCEQYYYRNTFCKHMENVRDYYDTYLGDEFPEFHDVIHSDVVYNEIQQNF